MVRPIPKLMIDNETSKLYHHSVKRNVFLRYVDVIKCYRRLARVHVSRSVLEVNNALQPHMFIFSERILNSLSV